MKRLAMIMLMITMFIAGGLMFAECSADVEETAPEAVTEEIAPEIEPETVTEETEPEVEAPEAVETEPETPEQIIEAQTGLQVDYIKRIEGNSTWCAWYIEADGDIYVVTIKSGNVNKCVILN